MLLAREDDLLGAVGLQGHRLLVRQPAADDAEHGAIADVPVRDGAGADFLDHHAAGVVVEERDAQLRTMLRKEVHAADPRVDRGVPSLKFETTGGDFFGEDAAGGVGRGVVALLGLEDQVAEATLDAGDDATLGGVIAHMVDRRELRREELLQPGLLDGRRQGEVSGHAAAGLDLVDFGGDQQLGLTDRGFATELTGASVHQGAAEGAGVEADGKAVGEAQQQTAADGGRVGDAVADRQPLPFGEPQELTSRLIGLARRLTVHAEAVAGVGVELEVDRLLEERKPREEIRAVLLFDGIAGVLGPVVDLAEEDVTALGEAGDPADLIDAIKLTGGEQHARITRMSREDRHPSPDRGELALDVDGPEIGQHGQRTLQGLVIRLLVPRETRGLAPARRQQQQDRLGEVDALDLRDFAERAGFMVGLRPEADATAGTGSAGATGALLGGGLRNRLHQQGVDAAVRVEARDAGQAGIDHGADAGNGQ